MQSSCFCSRVEVPVSARFGFPHLRLLGQTDTKASLTEEAELGELELDCQLGDIVYEQGERRHQEQRRQVGECQCCGGGPHFIL